MSVLDANYGKFESARESSSTNAWTQHAFSEVMSDNLYSAAKQTSTDASWLGNLVLEDHSAGPKHPTFDVIKNTVDPISSRRVPIIEDVSTESTQQSAEEQHNAAELDHIRRALVALVTRGQSNTGDQTPTESPLRKHVVAENPNPEPDQPTPEPDRPVPAPEHPKPEPEEPAPVVEPTKIPESPTRGHPVPNQAISYQEWLDTQEMLNRGFERSGLVHTSHDGPRVVGVGGVPVTPEPQPEQPPVPAPPPVQPYGYETGNPILNG